MDLSDKRLQQLLREAQILFSDPRHPVNNRHHPKHRQAVAALKLIEEHGSRLLSARTQHE